MSLAAALRNRPLAIVAGSRFSASSSNREALLALYRASQPECGPDENPCAPWLLGARLRRALGSELASRLEKQISGDDAQLDSVTKLTALPIDLVLTTSMAHGWERAFASHDKVIHSLTPGQSPDYDYDAIVYHLFGKTSQPESLLLCDADYERIKRDSDVQSLLQSWWSSRVLVFLGFSTNDDELRVVLEHLLPPGSEGSHYAFMKDVSLNEQEELKEQYGIEVMVDVETAVATLSSYLDGAPYIARENTDLDAIMARAAHDAHDPAVASGFELLEHRLRQDGSYERLVDVHVARLSVAEEPAEKQQILLETASLLEHKMHDTDRAFHATLAAYRELPNKDLWSALRRQAHSHDNLERLATSLMESRATLRKTDRLPALLLAIECYREVGDTGSAIEAIEQVNTDPENEEKVAQLHRALLTEAERWYELTRSLEQAADRANFNDEREEHLLGRADVLQTRLNEPWAAIECYQQVLAINPSNGRALESVERLFLHLHQVPALLDLLYDYGDRYTPAELSAKLWRLGEQCRSRGDHTGAVLCFEKLRDEEPGNEKLLAELSELYVELGETSQLVDILKAKVGAAKSVELRASLCEQLAIAHEELGNVDEAAECWEWVCHDAPMSTEAVAALERLYRRGQHWQSLLALYSRQRERATGSDKRRWIVLMADVYQNQLSEFGPAIELLSELRAKEPHDSELGARILLLLEHAGRYGEAARLADDLADEGTGNAEATLRQHATRLWQQQGQPGKAIVSLEAAIKASPERADLHKQLAELLQSQGEHLRAAEEYDRASLFSTGFESTKFALLAARCFETLNATDRGIEVLEHRWLSGSEERIVAVELRRLYEARGRHADLITLLEKQNERVRQEEKLEQLLALADAHAALGQSSEEIECLRQAVQSFPERTDIARQLAETALNRKMFDVAEEACNTLVENVSGVEDQAAAYCLLARLAYERADLDSALKHLAKARQLAPFDRRALSLLVEFSAKQPEAQIGYLRALLLDAPAEERAGILIRIGDLCRDELDERAEARDAYQSALLLRPDDHLLLHRCLAFAVEDRQWDESLEYLDHLIKTEKDPSVRARYRSTTAHLYEEELHDVDAAIALLWQAAEEAPHDLSVLRRLIGHMRAKKDWQALLDCNSLLLAALRDDPRVTAEAHARAWVELAQLCATELDDRETAMCALEVAVSLQPTSLAYRDRLAGLYQEDGRFHDAIAQHQAILDIEPSLLPSYTALARLFEGAGNASAALACEQAVSTMCGETPTHIKVPKARTATLIEEQVAMLRHHDDRFAMGRLLALMTPAIATLAPNRRRRSTFSGLRAVADSHALSKKIASLAKQLGVHPPVVFQDLGSSHIAQGGIERSAESLVPSITVNELVGEAEWDRKTYFVVCRTLVTLRREYLVTAVQPNFKSLGHALDAIAELTRAREGAPVSKTATALARATDAATLEQAKALMRKLSPDKRTGHDMVRRWAQASGMSANRMALWIGGDLLAGLQAVDELGLSQRELEEARQDLIRCFCSPVIRTDMQPEAIMPLTRTPHESQSEGATAQGKSLSLRKDFRNIARTVTEEIRLDSL